MKQKHIGRVAGAGWLLALALLPVIGRADQGASSPTAKAGINRRSHDAALRQPVQAPVSANAAPAEKRLSAQEQAELRKQLRVFDRNRHQASRSTEAGR